MEPNDDVLVCFGGAAKEIADMPEGTVGGYLVLFSDAAHPDAEGDFFTPSTDFDLEACSFKSRVLYRHGLDKKLSVRKLALGPGALKQDEVGIWVQAQLDLRDRYEAAVYGMAKEGKLGWSSGTINYLVRQRAVGRAKEVLTWPLGLDASLTPNPAEPRTRVVALKSLLTDSHEFDPTLLARARAHFSMRGHALNLAKRRGSFL